MTSPKTPTKREPDPKNPLDWPSWRLCHLYAIRGKDGQFQRFRPNVAQRTFFNNEWCFNHILKARQMGFSTFLCLENLDAMLFNENTACGLIDYSLPDARKKLQIIRLGYETLDNKDIHPDTWQTGRLIKQAVQMNAKADEIIFSNGSSIQCSTSHRGTTVQRLHISELGKTAFMAPLKAEEIRTGALNTIASGQVINIESTHEGGKTGMHYAMLRRAMELQGQKLTANDPKFHFYPWYLMSEYAIDAPDVPIRPEIRKYFERLEAEHGIKLTREQMLWYDRKEAQQGFGMLKEFPSTPGEAFNALVEGAIYGNLIADLRAKGRVTSVPPDPIAPMFTGWDIGASDYTAIWLVQPVGREFLWLDHYENNRQHASHYADIVRMWEQKYNRRIALHAMPHDAANMDRGTAQSYVQLMRECGISNVVVVPRTPDVWRSINNVRKILPASWFNASTTDIERRDENGNPLPSGVGCLEAYRTKATKNADSQQIREMPLHDASSHSCDAARTFADAWEQELLYNAGMARPVTNNHDIWNRKPRRRRPW